jgi:bifunctional enzyme CysN/CysC
MSEVPYAGRGATVWLTGLSGSGKSTIAEMVHRDLSAAGVATYILDGDVLRRGLNADLGFSAADRAENVRRVGQVARLLCDAGLIVLVPVISPYRQDRSTVKSFHTEARLPFYEIYVATPLAVCEERDPKGLYAQARAGKIRNFTGVSDPYEIPLNPDLMIDTSHMTPDAAAAAVIEILG